MRLNNKIALITGGSKGIGKGIAKVFLQEGAKVIICSRDEETLTDSREKLKQYGKIYSFPANITKLDDIRNLHKFISDSFYYLDILVNNASILGLRSKIIDYSEHLWNSVIQVNLNAQFYIIKSLLPLLMMSKNASIINVSSSVGRKGKAEWGAYAASKFGLEGLTQVLADELKDTKIRVNSVNPGGTRTDMRADAYPDEDPMSLPTPEDISPIFTYLASDESFSINGQQFNARDYINKLKA